MFWRGCHALDAQTRASLVDEVDGLVGEVTIRNVTVGQVRRGNQRLVGDGDPVMGLVAIAQPLENLDGVRNRGLLNQLTGWKRRSRAASFSRCLRYSSSVVAPMVWSSPRAKHRLQDRCRVDGTFGRTGTDERVDLVDERG